MTKGERMSGRESRDLMRRVADEADESYLIAVHFSPQAAMCVVGNLQLALRHPKNVGESADIARRVIAGLIERLREGGFPAHAELAEAGEECGV